MNHNPPQGQIKVRVRDNLADVLNMLSGDPQYNIKAKVFTKEYNLNVLIEDSLEADADIIVIDCVH